jgi:hypothetical protein
MKMKHPMNVYDKEAALSGVGANALWNGPFNTTGFPKGQGNSNGKDGVILNNDKPVYNGSPITQRAKSKF